MMLYPLETTGGGHDSRYAYFLVFSQPKPNAKTSGVGHGENIVLVDYIGYQHRMNIPNNKRPHNRFDLTMVLPQKDAVKLADAVLQTPQVIEQIFQGIFPELTGDSGLQRVQSGELLLATRPDLIVERHRLGKISGNAPLPEFGGAKAIDLAEQQTFYLKFPQVVGELPS